MLKYFVVLLCFLLFVTKSYVFYLNRTRIELEKEWSKVKKDLNLLNVEWRYLNQPNRVQELAKKVNKGIKSEN